MKKNLNDLIKFAVAAAIYASFAVYLYQPYLKNFNQLQYLIMTNVCLAALGSFILSRRWVASFAGSLFAGAIYGFGPFTLGLAKFHPTAGAIVAAVPWLFCPAAYASRLKWRWLSWPLSALPFLAIVLFFQISERWRLFAVPIQTKLNPNDLAGLLAPLVMAERGVTVVGFYQVPIAALMVGFFVLLVARRLNILIIFAIGTVLAFCNPVLAVSPMIWLTIPVLICSILIGAGLQGFAWAGTRDKKSLLIITVIMGLLAIVTLLMAGKYFQVFAGLADKYANLLFETAKMYLLGAVAVGIIFFIVRAKFRVTALRLIIMCSAMAVDIFLGARFIVDKIC
ncbi:MAG: hypothetical protein ACYS0I_09810 [Planctomycetota bacterium]|jgi:hypothetical protein